MTNAAMTNASQPKVAVFQWLALQRPIRAAMLFERFRGDISGSPWKLSLPWLQARTARSRREYGEQASRGADNRTPRLRSSLMGETVPERPRRANPETPWSDPRRR